MSISDTDPRLRVEWTSRNLLELTILVPHHFLSKDLKTTNLYINLKSSQDSSINDIIFLSPPTHYTKFAWAYCQAIQSFGPGWLLRRPH